jgi:hypothetical protein
MTLQEQNKLRTGNTFYFPELGPAQWEYKDGLMRCHRSYFMRTGHFVRWVYLTGPDGKKTKCARCWSTKDPFRHYFGDWKSWPMVSVPVKVCCLDQDKLKALVAKIAKEEQQMLTECAEKTVERMKATINKISKGGKR